ncbi:hypothetical protein EVG20_g3578 [Dentipellis fragilis]|uniref:Uncharacterized protein n=1 Tax=Dentipellis fragilis TaxID=205917 RepID=A0A4Y9Z4X6_9AGAM|nr:hypothetical protein EVG20_g3578 [Dentipellis fragilis]
MATPNPFSGCKGPSAGPPFALNGRPASERPKGSLPTYSRPQPWRPSLPHTVRTPGYSAKNTRLNKGPEGALARKYREEEKSFADSHRDRSKRVQHDKDVEDLHREADKITQETIFVFQSLVGGAYAVKDTLKGIQIAEADRKAPGN